MTWLKLIRRSLRYHYRANLGVVLGTAVGSTALVGALIVGDSVRGSLRERALAGLGQVAYALTTPDRLVREALPEAMPGALRDSWHRDLDYTWVYYLDKPVGVLAVPGIAASQDAQARANHVNVLGVSYDPGNISTSYVCFWDLSLSGFRTPIQPGEVWLNQGLARQLQAKPGDQILLRVGKPSAFSQDAALSPRLGPGVAWRLRVAGILGSRDLGDLSLRASPTPPLNAFVNLAELQKLVGAGPRVNTLLGFPIVADDETLNYKLAPVVKALHARRLRHRFSLTRRSEAPVEETLEAYASDLKDHVTLADYQASLLPLTNGGVELRSSRVFVDPPLARAALDTVTNAVPVLTYLANLISSGSNATPYSMVTAAGPPYTPAGLRDDEIMLTEWLADDLHARAGDSIEMSWFAPDAGAALRQVTNRFRVRGIVPMQMPWSDRSLMPDFPGIEGVERTADWDAGFPLVYKIRPKDEDYWRQHRGTPKAFISLAAGQKHWGNRFGNVTAVRFPPRSVPKSDEGLEKQVLSRVAPSELGLEFQPVRAMALKSASESQDFGGLFIGFSFFLIIAALLLVALLFKFAVEQRAAETGTYLALGFSAGRVRALLLGEAFGLALLGSFFGVLGGVLYARAMLAGLASVWSDAVSSSQLNFHASATSVVGGACASLLCALFALALTLRTQARQSVRDLLAGQALPAAARAARRHPWLSIAAGCGAIALVVWGLLSPDRADPGLFFGAGFLSLICGVGLVSAWLRISRHPAADSLTPARLALRGCARRRSRSVTTVALLASGSFVVISLGVFRLDANRDATDRHSGTGGVALIGDSTLPVTHDLNTRAGREFYGLSADAPAGLNVISFRVLPGDEASCLNLNRAQKPRLLGVEPARLSGRFTFAAVAKGLDRAAGWNLLKTAPGETNVVPAIGDANSIQWALGKKVGDTLDFVDGLGRPFKLRLVGTVANSILQGNLVIDESEFVRRFPGVSGFEFFLVDAPSNQVAQISGPLARALQDTGLELAPAVERLNAFNAVQNTYLGTFQVLGGLGLLLGSAGLGIVVLRNVLERRSELAVLRAVGFQKRALERLVLAEHGALLLTGLALGIVAAALAVLPPLLVRNTPFPVASLAMTLAGVFLNGLVWTWLATRQALRGNFLGALRNE